MKNPKQITLIQGTSLYISAILGSGVLFLSGSTASVAGPASIISWLIMIGLSFPLALTFAYLSRAFPDAGGASTFVRMAFGEHWGNLVGWFYFVTATVGQVIVSMTGAYYTGTVFSFTNTWMAILAIFILLAGGISNHLGLKVSGKIAVTLSFILLLLITTATVSAIPYIRLENFSPFMPNGWKAVGVAITMIFWSFFGWEAISNLSDQFRHPKTDIIRSTLISAVLISIVFLSLSIITVGTFSYGDMTSNLSTIGVIMNKTLGTSAQIVTALLAFIICLGTVNAFVASLGQLGYALARDHAFPRYFCHVNHRYHSPVRAIWFVIICAVTGVIISFVWSIPFSNLIFIPNSLGIIVYILSAASGLRLFHKQSLTWWLSLIAFFICLLFLPFFGVYLLVPVIVLMLYFVYIKGVSYKSTANSGIAGGKER